MATTPNRAEELHKFLKLLSTALIVSAGSLVALAASPTASASSSPKKSPQSATLIAPIAPPLRQYSDTRIIVSFKDGTSREAIRNAERAIGAREISFLHVDSAYLLATQSGHVLDGIRILKLYPVVRYAEPDYFSQLAATPNDPSFPIQWADQNTGQIVNGVPGTPALTRRLQLRGMLSPESAQLLLQKLTQEWTIRTQTWRATFGQIREALVDVPPEHTVTMFATRHVIRWTMTPFTEDMVRMSPVFLVPSGTTVSAFRESTGRRLFFQ